MQRALKLLLVEDLESDARLILKEISRAGFTCDFVCVETEEDFLGAARSDLDLIITDYKLPTMSASDVFRIVRERGWDVPIIVISGYIDDATAADLVWKGAADFLLKDRLARLGIAIESALSRRQADDEKRMQYKILEESESRLSLALDTADLAVLTWQLNSERCTADTRWVHLVGVPLSEAVENLDCWIDRVHDLDRDDALRNLEAMRQGHLNHFTLQQRLQNAVGDWLWVICKARVVRLDDSNQPLRACITFQDITAYKHGLTALERKSKMLDIIRVAQHELLAGAPSVDGFCSLLDGILDMTRSRFGFINSVRFTFPNHSSHTSLAIADPAGTPEYQRMSMALQAGKGMEIPGLDGVLKEVTTGGMPLLSGLSQSEGGLARRGDAGLPFKQCLAIPVRKGNEMIGLLFLADPADPYTYELVEELDPFVQTCAQLISAWADRQERESAERRLLESERHFRTLAETEAVLIWTMGKDGICDYLNPACHHYIVSDGGSIGYETWLDIVVDDDRAQFEQVFWVDCAKGEPVSLVVRAVDLEGEIHWLQVEGHPRLSSSQEVFGYVFYGLDITARMEAERKREESAELLSQLFELAPDPVLILKDQCIIRVNRRCTEQLGGAPEIFEGRLIPEILATSEPYMAQALNQLHTKCWRADGTWFPAEVNAAVVKLDGEEVSLVCIRDMSPRDPSESKLIARWNEKEQLFRDIHRHTLENLEKISRLLNPHLENLPESQKLALQECVSHVKSISLLHEQAEDRDWIENRSGGEGLGLAEGEPK